jgi:hypothetical protein
MLTVHQLPLSELQPFLTGCVAKKVSTTNRIVVLGNACCGSDGGSASVHF